MRIKSESIKKYIALILYILFGAIIIRNTNSPLLHFAILSSFAVFSSALVKFNVFHPYTWLSIFCSLYNGAYSLLLSIGYNSSLGYDYKNILYPFISLGIMLLIIGPQIRESSSQKFKKASVNPKFIKFILFSLSIISIIFSIILFTKGYAGKAEMKQVNDVLYRVGVYLVRYISMFLILLIACKPKNTSAKLVILAILSTIIFSLITGERDAMFRSIASLLLMLFGLGKIKKKHLLILIPIFVLLMVLSVAFKYYFSKGIINEDYLDIKNITYSFLSSDFISAGENLQKLLITPWTKGVFGVGLIVMEIISFMLPSSFVPNPDHWFNYEVYTGAYHGRAFTLVGTGYVASGVIGIIIVAIILAVLIKYLYKKSVNNIYALSVYVYMITTIIFSFRQSLAVISISLFRIAILSIIICRIAAVNKNENKKITV